MALEKPGGGLPKSEFNLIKKILIPAVRILITKNIAYMLFMREARIIKRLVQNCDNLQKRVLINKTFAIEDNSRDFSINMVLEHLSITGELVLQMIACLNKEQNFNEVVTIEGVKPFKNKQDALSDFIAFVDNYQTLLGSIKIKSSYHTKAHPWFGAFNDFDWVIFLYMHSFIHRRQIQEIIATLKSAK